MPKKYRQVRARLIAARWVRVRSSGFHETWRSPDGQRAITVAGKDSDTVPRGTLAAMRRATGLDAAMTEYLVIYERAEDGAWGAHSPDLDGVFALAPTREGVEARMAEAIRAHLEALHDFGQSVPKRHTEVGYLAP